MKCLPFFSFYSKHFIIPLVYTYVSNSLITLINLAKRHTYHIKFLIMPPKTIYAYAYFPVALLNKFKVFFLFTLNLYVFFSFFNNNNLL